MNIPLFKNCLTYTEIQVSYVNKDGAKKIVLSSRKTNRIMIRRFRLDIGEPIRTSLIWCVSLHRIWQHSQQGHIYRYPAARFS
ncbi:MAG: hypothetical protein WCD89_03745 [Anaerocolumna sp.]